MSNITFQDKVTGAEDETGEMSAADVNEIKAVVNGKQDAITGGNTDQVLAKSSNSDGAFKWVDQGAGGIGQDGHTPVYYSGSGAPASSVGVNGDLYLNNANGDLYGKNAGSWSVLGNIKGPQGPQGIQGVPGADGSTLTADQLLSLTTNTGTVMFTQEGGDVRADLNVILDAPGGLVSQNALSFNYYDKTYIDQQLFYILGLIGAPTGVEALPNLVDWFKIDAGIALVSGAVDTWTGVKGTVLTAPSGIQRPTYSANGGSNNQAFMGFAGNSFLIGNIAVPTTQDMCIIVVTKNFGIENTFSQSPVAFTSNGNAQDFNIQAKASGYIASSMGNFSYSEAYKGATNDWALVFAKCYRSESTDEAKIAVNGVAGSSLTSTDNTNGFAAGVLSVGGFFDQGSPLYGQVSDVIILSTKSTTSDENVITTTLNTKFDIY